MFLDKNMSMALKNSWGQYKIEDFTMFRVEELNEKFSRLDIKLNRNGELKLKIKCPICGEHHYYSYSISELVKRDVIIGGCEVIGCPLFYIGNKDNVEGHINRFNEIKKQVYAMI